MTSVCTRAQPAPTLMPSPVTAAPAASGLNWHHHELVLAMPAANRWRAAAGLRELGSSRQAVLVALNVVLALSLVLRQQPSEPGGCFEPEAGDAPQGPQLLGSAAPHGSAVPGAEASLQSTVWRAMTAAGAGGGAAAGREGAAVAVGGAGATAAAGAAGAAPGRPVRLFVGVLSRAKNAAVRQAIRDSWGGDARLVRVMFFVLRPRGAAEFRALREEAVAAADVVVVSGTLEAYGNTTYSVLELFRAAALYAPHISHVLKTDEDCYVRVPQLLDALARQPATLLYGGYPMTPQPENIRVIRDPAHKWYVSYANYASDEPVPPYAWGVAALLSADLVGAIGAGLPHALSAPDNLMKIEDIAVGLWVDAAVKQERAVRPGAALSLFVTPVDQFGCHEDELVSHLGYLGFTNGTAELAASHGCMHERGGRCCDRPALLRYLVRAELAAGGSGGGGG